jgi:hypothetical protein
MLPFSPGVAAEKAALSDFVASAWRGCAEIRRFLLAVSSGLRCRTRSVRASPDASAELIHGKSILAGHAYEPRNTTLNERENTA